MPFLDELALRLENTGNFTIGSNVFLSSKSVLPEDAAEGFITIIEYGGSGAIRRHNGTPIESPSAELISHADDMPTARALLQMAFDALGGFNGLHNTSIGGIFYVSLVPRQSFVDIGTDDKSRARIAFNLDAQKEPS